MPPHQTDLTPRAERDPAGLAFDLPIALAKDEALAAARLNVPIPALALRESGAAGPSTTSVSSLLRRYWRAFQKRRLSQSLRTDLYRLSDRELTDIGLTRAEIDYFTPERAIDTLRDNTRYLWGRGGM